LIWLAYICPPLRDPAKSFAGSGGSKRRDLATPNQVRARHPSSTEPSFLAKGKNLAVLDDSLGAREMVASKPTPMEEELL